MKLFIGFLAAVALVFIGYKIKYPTYSWHQKMTIVVDTPSGPVSGSSVSAVDWTRYVIAWGNLEWSGKQLGEAVVVDLGGGRHLFALIRRPGNPDYLGTVAPASIAGLKGRSATEALFHEVSRQQGRAQGVIVVPDYQWPLMVTFTDITNPTTLRLVNPYNFAGTFGAGYALNSVTIDITDDPITEGRVESVLNWLQWPKIDPNLNQGRTETLRYPNKSKRGYGEVSTISFIWRE